MKIFDNNRTYSINEFGGGVVKFASQIKHQYKIQHESYIGIMMDRSIEMVASIYSVIYLECAYVPVDTSWPESRILECFENANVKFVLTDLKFKNRVENLGFTAIVPNFSFDSSNSNIDQWRISNKKKPAYVLYTSGSTGKPKGVVIPQSAVLNLVSYIQKRYPLTFSDSIMFKSPYTFDGSIWEIFAWTESNANLYVAPVGMEKDPEQLLNAIHKHRISFIFFVPAMLNSFLDYLSIADINPQESFPNLKWISVGGETLSVQLVQKFYEYIDFNKTKLINVYGPTETTVYATTYLCDPNEKLKKIPIGYPVDNYQIYILKENLELAKQGEEGEIFIGGEGVALGYLNREELTAERFIPDHIKGQGIMYRTGDIGVESTPGIFDFIGRKDFQVKIRGYRMEMGEIEYAINNLPYIKEAVAIAVKDSNNQGVLLCFAIIEQTTITSEDQQKNQMVQDLQRVLPEYMIPDHIFFVKEFPLSENGKVDRNRLSNQYLSINQTPTIEQNTITDFSKQNLEIVLTQCWSYVLDLSIDTIEKQRESTFFELGGNSIKSIQLIVQIKKRLDIKLSIGELYQNSTLNDQVSLIIEKSKEGKKADSLSNLEPQSCSLTSKFLLTPVQRQMWAMHHLDPTHKINNIKLEIDVVGCTITEAIQGFEKTLNHFDALKTTFTTEDEQVYQVVDKKLKSPKIAVIDNNENNTVFDLDKFPLYHTTAKEHKPNHTKFTLTIHHIIFDGWSLSLFMNKLNEFLNSPQQTHTQPDNHTELLAKAVALLNNQERDNLQKDLNYWSTVLADIPTLAQFPKKESAQPQNATQNGERYWWSINSDTSHKIEQFCSQIGVTQYALFLSAYQIVLSTISAKQEIVTGSPYVGREEDFLQQIIGYYTNMIAIRANVQANKKSLDFVKEQMSNALNCFSHSNVSFGTIQKHLNKEAKIGSNTLYNNIFVLQNWPHTYNQNSKITLNQKEVGNKTSKSDFLLNIEKKAKEFICWIEYDTALYNKELTSKIANAIDLCINLILEKNDFLYNIKSKILETYKREFKFTCAIIGNGSLVESCAQTIREKNGFIALVIDDRKLDRDECKVALEQHSPQGYDYIFSINNGHILTKETLELATKGCYNYHDSLLPSYAGVNATNWALINQESMHGISWHKMDQGIDTGQIAVQIEVPILQESQSVMSGKSIEILNTKCFYAAIEGFRTLIDTLINPQSNPPVKDFSARKRSYYGATKRPDNFGFINNNNQIGLIAATLYSGIYDNLFMSLKAYENNTIFYLTPNNAYSIEGLEIKQKPIDLEEYIKNTNLNLEKYIAHKGPIDSSLIGRCIKNEDLWVEEFSKSQPAKWPFVYQKSDHSWHKIESPESKVELMANSMISLLKLSQTTKGTFAICKDPHSLETANNSLISCWLPITIEYDSRLDKKDSFQKICSLIQNRIEYLNNQSSFLSDIFIRYQKFLKEQPENFMPNIAFSVHNNNLYIYTEKGDPKHIEYIVNHNLDKHLLINKAVCSRVEMQPLLLQFEKMAHTYSSHNAIEDLESGKIITYSQLSLWIDNIYNLLIETNIQQKSPIGVVTTRGAGYIAHILALLKHNCTFVPIDKTLPQERIDYIIKDSGCKYIIEEYEPTKIVKCNTSDTNLDYPKNINIGAYIIYTSGTTGTPKGVLISQKALHNFVSSASDLYKICNKDRVLQFSSLTFDACIEEIFCTLLNGATLIIRDSQMTDISHLVEKTIAKHITIWDLPTAFWREILLSNLYSKVPEHLRTVILGGEALKNSDLKIVKELKIKHTIINSYGPTEATVVALAHPIDLSSDTNYVPIGRPLAGYEVAIVDKNMQQTPPYIPGELLISGESLADGYINDSSKTNKAFSEIKIGNSIKSERFYKTGDMVYYDQNGLIYYLGRIDSQLKIRGFRVEPQEIEYKIKQIAGVKDCAVIAFTKDTTIDLVAFIATNHPIEQQQLREQSSKMLPNYMIPQYFIDIDSIPLNRSGKTDTKELERIFNEYKQQNTQSSIPQEQMTEQEIVIKDIWQQILKFSNFSKESSFFEIGGDSLSAVRMVPQINNRLNLKNSLPLSALITNPTIEKLSSYIQNLQHHDKDKNSQILVKIRDTGDKKPLFVVHGGGLNILLYRSLSNELKQGRCVYALQAKGLDGKTELSTSIEEMATDYIEEILKVEAQGPIYLLGFSLGGFIAYEMAQKLQDRGIEVGFVAMVDSVATMANTPHGAKESLSKIKHLFVRPIYNSYIFIKALLQKDNQLINTKIRNYKIKLDYYAIKLKLKKAQKAKITFIDGIPQFQNKNIQLIMHNALTNYSIKKANFNLELFKAQKNTFYIPDREHYGWKPYALKGLNITTMPGEHSRLFANENSSHFAKQLDTILDKYDSIYKA